MNTYILLIVYLFILNILYKKNDKIKLIAMFIPVYLLLALKNISVGFDIKGYKRIYELSKHIGWGNFDFVYFEKGYILLMQSFSKLDIDFQVFNAFLYIIILVPVFFFINKYSSNNFMSLIIYVCYQFFVFNISGLRQSFAMGIALFAITYFLLEKDRAPLIYYILILLSTTIHRSALIMFFLPIIFKVKVKFTSIVIYIVSLSILLVLKSKIDIIIGNLLEINITSYQIGLNFYFLVIILIFLSYTLYESRSSGFDYLIKTRIIEKLIIMVYYSIFLYVLLSGSTLLRGVMYSNLALIVVIPSSISRYNYNSQKIIEIVFISIFIFLFYKTTLSINQLGLLPYEFFWN